MSKYCKGVLNNKKKFLMTYFIFLQKIKELLNQQHVAWI